MTLDWKTRGIGFLVGFLGAMGCIGVMVTALRFGGSVELSRGVLWYLCFSLLAAVLAGRKGSFLVPVLLGVLTVLCWKPLRLEHSLEALLYYISRLYASGYGWSMIRWSNDPLLYADASQAFFLLGAWLSMAITFGFLNRGGVWLGAFAAALPLLPCLILTDTVPEEKWLFLQLFSLIVLLFCSKNPKQGIYVTLPVALVLGGMFLLMPRETYQGQDAAERVWNWLEEKFIQADPEETTQTPVWAPDLETQQVNLSNAGPRPRWLIPAMHVTAKETATLYLRSLAFDDYTGTRWELDEEDSQFPLFFTGGDQKYLTVETLSVHDTLYLPYGSQNVFNGPQVLEDRVEGAAKNTFRATEYSVFYKTPDLSLVRQHESRTGVLSGFGGQIAINPDNGMVIQVEGSWARYLALPEETRARAEAWLDSHMPAASDSKWEAAQIICQLVAQSARYDLSTRRMPAGEDFAMWFLEESETGYCVHFASAAAVLLRAVGIPSRYVSGFVVSTVEDETVTVYQKNAHAWVEAYIEGTGWVMLEPTPGDGVEDTLSDTVPTTAPTETTEPTETTAETTAPTESVPDSKPTLPSQTTPNSGVDKPQNPSVTPQKKPLPQWVKGLLWISLASAALLGQWKLRRYLRKRWQRKGNLNRQVLKLWQEAVLLGKVLGNKPPEEFHRLAQKAKFSQHNLTIQERNQATHHLEEMRKVLHNAPLWREILGFLLAVL